MPIDQMLTMSNARKLMNSLGAKILVLAIIVLLLLIPYFMMVGLRVSRAERFNGAEAEVSEKWGGMQVVTAPILNVPVQRTLDDKTGCAILHILPETLKIDGTITPEIRSRGIYQVMLYKSRLMIEAEVVLPETEAEDGWTVKSVNDGELLLSFSDVKGIEKLSATVNGKSIAPVAGANIAIPLRSVEGLAPGGKLEVKAEVMLNGCRSLFVNPIGRTFDLTLASSWPHPSFTGGFLPREREIAAEGFTAKWSVSELNSSFTHSWVGELNDNLNGFDNHDQPLKSYAMSDLGQSVGVSLAQPSSTYLQVERVSNYAFLVISIVLIAFLIGERVTKIWIHPLQYFFAGLTLVMFYQLLLALSEHIAFNLSYAITTLVISGMTTLYCRMIFAKKKAAALLLGGIMLLAYCLIFALTRLEDYALLVGSVILLGILAILMRVTGNMNKREISDTEETLGKK